MAKTPKKIGRPSKFDPAFIEQARKIAALGAISLPEDQWIIDRLTAIRADADGVIAAQKRKVSATKRLRRAADPSERVRNAMSARMWAALKGRTDGALFSRLGYTSAQLVGHLEARFSPGMAWGNYGDWHVDHRRPCASFDMTDPEQFADCWELSNLQPLWAADNIRKGARHGAT